MDTNTHDNQNKPSINDPGEAIPSKKPHKPYKRNYNRNRVVDLAKGGVPASLIAKDQDVAVSTITRFLAKHDIQAANIKQYSERKSDCLVFSQLQNQTIENIIKSKWIEDPTIITSLDVRAQKEVIHTLQGGRYYDHQMERLELGKTTSNLAQVVFQMPTPQPVPERFKVNLSANQGIELNTKDVDIIDVGNKV